MLRFTYLSHPQHWRHGSLLPDDPLNLIYYNDVAEVVVALVHVGILFSLTLKMF